MRFLNTRTLELRSFSGASIPPYAILSHNWLEDEEISLDDMQFLNRCDKRGFDIKIRDKSAVINVDDDRRYHSLVQKSGYDKIKQCCHIAAIDGFDYVWVDTCCIDKSSSAELSEAINSMYRWYKLADVCYVYLADVQLGDIPYSSQLEMIEHPGSAFCSSRWFTRGWTLQELIAPAVVTFYGSDWRELGTKYNLRKTISRVTGIQEQILLDAQLESVSVAQRMSWAAKRQTTRVEDIAYCLMGIFSINMPMLYGEGARAYIRLQEEIIRNSDDYSILAWKAPAWVQDGGVLADSPMAFAESGNVVQSQRLIPMSIRLSNRGVQLQVPSHEDLKLCRMSDGNTYSGGRSLVVLNCVEIENPLRLLAISLKAISAESFTHVESYMAAADRLQTFVRDRRWDWTTVARPSQKFAGPLSDAFVPQVHRQEEPLRYERYSIDVAGLEPRGMFISETYPTHLTTRDLLDEGVMIPNRQFVESLSLLRFTSDDGAHFVLVLDQLGDMLAANIFTTTTTSTPLETLDQMLLEKQPKSISQYEGILSTPADQFIWQHPGGPWIVTVVIKRQLTPSGRRFVVKVGCTRQPQGRKTSDIPRR